IFWFFLANTVIFWILGTEYLKNIFLSGTLYFANYPGTLGKIFVIFFWLVSYLSFMMFLVLMLAAGLILVAFLMPSKRLIWFLSALFASLSIVFLIVDTRIYMMFKFHLNSIILQLFFQHGWVDFFDFSEREIAIFSILSAVICFFEICLVYLIWKKIIVKDRFRFEKRIVIVWFGGCLFTYFTLISSMTMHSDVFSQQIANLPLFHQLFVHLIPHKQGKEILRRFSEMNFSQPLFCNDKLNYPLHPMKCTKPEKPYNLILIMVDSLRFDSLSYMPNVTQFAKKTWQFKNHLSGGNSTQPGLFSIFYSIPGSYWTAALEQRVPAVLTELLVSYHYSTEILWSNELYNPPFDKTIYTGLTHLDINGSKEKDIGNKDRDITNKAIKFLVNNDQKTPFFLHLFYDSPHGFCREQSYPKPYQPALKSCARLSFGYSFDPLLFYNRYRNSVNFVDGEIAKVLNTIEQQGYLDNSVIIFTSDHGQEFNDNKQNYWGHTGNFTRAQVQVPLLIHWPGQAPRTIDYLTSSYDIVPTLLKRLYACQNATKDYSIGQDLLENEGRLPFIISGSYVNMGIIESDRLTNIQISGNIDITTVHAEPRPFAKPRID
ncbi:MAG: DUF3413 domain-containing protein, partial [Gammaproteobacteria bacterium]|nr:DUF3413 domain-containing protein [Gammaproteobacteria bacterium]